MKFSLGIRNGEEAHVVQENHVPKYAQLPY